jgi:hypothetical protein
MKGFQRWEDRLAISEKEGGSLAKLPELTGTLGLTGRIGVDLGRRSPIERLSGPASDMWRQGSRARRRTAGAERRLAGGEPKMAFRLPFARGKALN